MRYDRGLSANHQVGRSQRSGTPPRSDDTATLADRLASRIEAVAPPNTLMETLTRGLTLYAWSDPKRRTHLVYRPSLCVVLRGAKRATVAAKTHAYDASRFFFAAAPLPARLDVRCSPHQPLVGMVLELDIALVARVALDIDAASTATHGATAPVALTGELTSTMIEVLDRLVIASTDALRQRVLQQALMSEVVFELLVGPQGPALRRAVHEQGKLRPLLAVMRHIDEHSHQPLRVAALARRAGMSESSFFACFRAATGTTPLQYVKTLRLTKARLLLDTDAASVTEVAYIVGYASGSQFSRDFRRAFGVAPSSLRGARRT